MLAAILLNLTSGPTEKDVSNPAVGSEVVAIIAHIDLIDDCTASSP